MINLRDRSHRPLIKIQSRIFDNYKSKRFLTQKKKTIFEGYEPKGQAILEGQKSKVLQLKYGRIQYQRNSNLRSKEKHFKVSSLPYLNNNNINDSF